MNIEEYISSGIVESYVLGLADEQERVEFERMCDAHHEVRAAREAFELSLEKYALENAIKAPRQLKSSIFAGIDMQTDQLENVSFPAPEIADVSSQKVQAPVIRADWQKWLAVAAVILLVCSTILNFYLFNQYRSYSSRYATLLASQQELASNNQTLQAKLQEYETSMGLLKNPAMLIVKMPGVATSPDPNSAATVYWDTRTKDVYLVVNQLPMPDAGRQYQLWAMVDGKPVDAGVFEMGRQPMVKMKNIPRAEAFAITLEKKGGSPTPNLNMLYVLGKV